jgi:hypothetical protein
MDLLALHMGRWGCFCYRCPRLRLELVSRLPQLKLLGRYRIRAQIRVYCESFKLWVRAFPDAHIGILLERLHLLNGELGRDER